MINKIDLMPDDDRKTVVEDLIAELSWQGPVFLVSAELGAGTEMLGQAIMRQLDEWQESED